MRPIAVMRILPALAMSAWATVAAAAPAPDVIDDAHIDEVYAGLLKDGPPKGVFDFTPDFRDNVATPILKKVLPYSWQNYAIDLPLIGYRPDGNIGIVFAYDLDQGVCPDYSNPPYAVIVIDIKTRKPTEVVITYPTDGRVVHAPLG